MKYAVKIVKQLVVYKISGNNKLSRLPTDHRLYNSPNMCLTSDPIYSTPPN